MNKAGNSARYSSEPPYDLNNQPEDNADVNTAKAKDAKAYSHEDVTAEFGYCVDCENPLKAYENKICLDCEAKRNAEFGNTDFL